MATALLNELTPPPTRTKARKTIFNSDGEEDEEEERDHRMDTKESSTTLEELTKQHVEQIKHRLQETDLQDKERARERVRLKHLKRRVGRITTTSSSAMDISNQADEGYDDNDAAAAGNDGVISISAPSATTSDNDYHVSRDMEDAVLRATS